MIALPAAPTPHHYHPDIDGLRALAVLAVLAGHAFPGHFPAGFIGVDIFFVISGYLISGNIFAELQSVGGKNTFSLIGFYSRRIQRIFPALILVLSAVLVAGWVALLPGDYAALGRHVTAGAGFSSNLLLWNEAGYFDSAAASKPLLHLWSLGVEEQYYLIWPLLLCLTWRWSPRWIGPLLLAVLTISFALNIHGIHHDGVATYYSPLTRLWELAAGASLAWLQRANLSMHTTTSRMGNLLSFVGLLTLIVAFCILSPVDAYPGWWAILPVAGTCALIAAGQAALINRRLFANRLAVAIGLISYPLYLWHWPLLAFPRLVSDAALSPAWRIMLMLIAVVLAILTERFVERPIRRDRRVGPVGLLGSMLVVGLAGGAVALSMGVPQRLHLAQYSLNPAVETQLVGAYWPYSRNAQCEAEYRYADADQASWWFCMKSSPRPTTVILMGNSFANHLYPGLVANPAMRHQTILSMGTCAVGMVKDRTLAPEHPCAGPRRLRQRAFLRDIIRRTPTIRFAIISPLPEHPDPATIAGIINEVRFLQSEGVAVLLVGPHIQPGFDIKQCYSAPFRSADQPCAVPNAHMVAMSAGLAPFRAALAEAHVIVPLFDPNVLLCSDDPRTCRFTHDGLPLFRDNGHFSVYGSIRLQAMLNTWAARNMPALVADEAPRSRYRDRP